MRDISEKRFQKPKEIPLCIYSKYIPPAPSPVYPAPLPLPLSFAVDAFSLAENYKCRENMPFHQSQNWDYTRSCSVIYPKVRGEVAFYM